MIRKARQHFGEAVVFKMVDFLSTELHEMQLDFIREQQASIEKEAGWESNDQS